MTYTDPSGNMNYFTQTDDLINGAIKGMGSWLWDIIKSPIVLISTIKQLVCGELTLKQVLEQSLDFLVKDIKYVSKHLLYLSLGKNVVNNQSMIWGII